MNKKYIPLIWLSVIIAVAIVIFVIASNPQWLQPKSGIIPRDGMSLEDPYFSDKVVIIYSSGCSVCKVVVPILRDIEQENNLTFYYYDASIESQLAQITDLNLAIEKVPTVIIYGKVYVGGRTKGEYETAILKK
ncbi:MAG: thioredoxin family protein [Candidatus Pacearchaeota archaeon]|nr:thioredoxin family protein [Candidatus Pacearchaeota archaeon]